MKDMASNTWEKIWKLFNAFAKFLLHGKKADCSLQKSQTPEPVQTPVEDWPRKLTVSIPANFMEKVEFQTKSSCKQMGKLLPSQQCEAVMV